MENMGIVNGGHAECTHMWERLTGQRAKDRAKNEKQESTRDPQAHRESRDMVAVQTPETSFGARLCTADKTCTLSRNEGRTNCAQKAVHVTINIRWPDSRLLSPIA